MKLATKFNLLLKKHLKLEPSKKDIADFVSAAKNYREIAAVKTYLDTFGARIVDKQNDFLKSALTEAAYYGNSEEVEVLLAAKAQVNKYDLDNNTALFYAAKRGHMSCLKPLLAAGADFDRPNVRGITPFLAAANEGHGSCMTALMEAGANVNAREHNGDGLQQYAAQHESQHIVDVVKSWKAEKAKTTSTDIKDFFQGTQKRIVVKGGKLTLKKRVPSALPLF